MEILMQPRHRQMLYLLPKTTGFLLHNQRFYRPVKYFKSVDVISIVNTKRYSNVARLFKWIESPAKKHKFKFLGAILYENIVDKLDYQYFFKEFKMDDTFFSWFLVTELHVYILMLRAMQENEDGQRIRNSIVEAMWIDVNTRAKKLGHSNSSIIKKHIELLSEQFNASIMGYDEAVASEDTCLAGHLWRRFLKCENNNPEDLEKLVYYVRKQVNSVGNLNSMELFSHSPNIEWKYV